MIVAVVDNDPSILDSMALLIEGQGWEANAYHTGEAFLADHERGGRIDCLILDPHLDGINGDEVARALVGSQIPIICLTARPESHVARRIGMLGALAMLTKPAKAQELVNSINMALSSFKPATGK